MAYDRFFPVALGPSYSGLADLRAQLRDVAGTAVGAEITISLERPGGMGYYAFTVPSIPDEHVGYVDIYQSATPTDVIFFVGVQPPDAIADAVAREMIADHSGVSGSFAEALAEIAGIAAGTDDLLARLTVNRATYLDKLNIGLATLAHTGNAETFKATGFSTVTVGQIWAAAERSLTEPVETDAASRNASKADLTAVLADLATLLSRLSADRAIYLDELNVPGVLAHSGDAARYHADLSAVALETTAQAIAAVTAKLDSMMEMPGTDWRYKFTALEESPSGDGTGASASELWTYSDRTLTGAVTTDAASREASKADLTALEGRLTAARAGYLDKLNVTGDLAHTDNSTLFQSGSVSGAWLLTVIAHDSVGNPVADVDVTVQAGGSTVTARRTGVDGTLEIPVNDGDYALYFYRFGWSFTNTSVTIAGANRSVTVVGDNAALTIPAPLNPEDCRVWERLRWIGASGSPPEEVSATAVIYDPHFSDDEAVYWAKAVAGTYDPSTGIVYWDIIPGANIHFVVTEYGLSTVRTIPAGVTMARLTDLVEIEAEDI